MKEIWEEINDNQKALEQCLRTLSKNGIENAKTEMEYRILKAKKIIEYKDKGYPVTLIPDLVKGDKEVAIKNYEKNCAEAIFLSNREALKVYGSKASDLRIIYEKEYNNAK